MKAARRAMARLYSFLKEKYGNVRIFWVAEPFDTKYGYHTHALVYIEHYLARNMKALLNKAWQVVTGGGGGKKYNNTVLKQYDEKLGANYYVAKYMMRNNADYDILL